MDAAVRRLRLVWIAALVYVGVTILVTYTSIHVPESPFSVQHGILLFMGILSAVGGFLFQRKLGKHHGNPIEGKSTPLGRWHAGHFMRVASAVAVALWGCVLSATGGPRWGVYGLFGAGIVLLLIWSPDMPPSDTQR